MNMTEYAKKHKVTKERVRQLIASGRILGTFKKGNAWFIPDNAKYPKKLKPWESKNRGE